MRGSGIPLEVTYIVRLFAEFEAVLLDYWHAVRRRKTNPPMEVLVNRVTALRFIDPTTLQGAHGVRDWRNAIVHKQGHALPLTFQECRSRLATFLSWLPLEW